MPNNSFIGQVYFLDGASYPTWLTYDVNNDVFQGSIKGVEVAAFEDIFTHQSDFDFSDSSSGEHIDRFGNTVVDTKATSGKLTITVDASIYAPMVKRYSGSPVNLVILSRDIDQGVYIHQVIPTFNKKTVAGKMQVAEMTFKFIQGANLQPTYQRHRLFELIAPAVNPN
jgi:hypothetical protein